ncbi:MAG TPA: nucleoside deaminase [Puia sp.]|nr:nucleoside deaminase [Puia sp.]
MTREERFMQEAVKTGLEGMRKSNGGPFGCVIVKDDEIIGRGYNRVTRENDPTAHAEVVAIRDACKNLENFQLTDCEIYATSEPCPMCMGAIYWARPKKIFYANTCKDAADIGFDDSFIYNELNKPEGKRKIEIQRLPSDNAKQMFEEWKLKNDKTLY